MSTPSPNVVRTSEIIEAVAKKLKLPKKSVKGVIEALAAVAGPALKSGKRVQIKGLGILLVRDVRVPAGQAPKAGAPAKRLVLMPSKTLKAQAGA